MNGPSAHPLYKFLKEESDGAEVGWNFHKFIVVDGKPVKRFASKVSPKKMEADIVEHLASDAAEDEYAYEEETAL